jgi:hypothetical protein
MSKRPSVAQMVEMTAELIDLEEHRDKRAGQAVTASPGLVRKKPERFVPMYDFDWAQQAFRTSIYAVGVASWLLYKRAVNESNSFAFHYSSLMKEVGVNRWFVGRAMKSLESAGLIKVTRHRGKHPEVEIIDYVK